MTFSVLFFNPMRLDEISTHTERSIVRIRPVLGGLGEALLDIGNYNLDCVSCFPFLALALPPR